MFDLGLAAFLYF